MPEETTASQLAVAASPEQQGAPEVRAQVNQIQYLMQSVLREGEHYGVVPGTGKNAKPTLFQSGAEKIAYMFKLVPSYEMRRTDYEYGHREYEVTCTLTAREGGGVMGYGVGLCSTYESKYRYRWVGKYPDRHREDNPDIADVWNTVLKMAKKRAFVDAVKSTTAASDIFTQDVEDMAGYLFQGRSYGRPERPAAPQPSPAPRAQAPDTTNSVDEAWVADAASRLAAASYDRESCVLYLSQLWAQEGRAKAEAAVAEMMAQATGVDAAAVIEPDAVEVA